MLFRKPAVGVAHLQAGRLLVHPRLLTPLDKIAQRRLVGAHGRSDFAPLRGMGRTRCDDGGGRDGGRWLPALQNLLLVCGDKTQVQARRVVKWVKVGAQIGREALAGQAAFHETRGWPRPVRSR